MQVTVRASTNSEGYVLTVPGVENRIPGVGLGAPYLENPNLHKDNNIRFSNDRFMDIPRKWLDECDNNHSAYKPDVPVQSLPKRLICVVNPKKPKIVESASLDQVTPRPRYLALSHKWGAERFAVTTADNIERRRGQIPLDDLPNSFKHAIAVTKALGCEYIWIDSLCILQAISAPDGTITSRGDFAEEADMMQTYFNGSYCVIAACSAQGAREGFLRDRDIQYAKRGNLYISPVINDFERDVLDSPLSRRGWVLQERALARRTIYFTNNQMYFECGDGIRCETLAKLKK